MAEPELRPCGVCGGPAQLYARWTLTSHEMKRNYVWVECASTPPCETGTCHKRDETAIAAWNKLAQNSRLSQPRPGGKGRE